MQKVDADNLRNFSKNISIVTKGMPDKDIIVMHKPI